MNEKSEKSKILNLIISGLFMAVIICAAAFAGWGAASFLQRGEDAKEETGEEAKTPEGSVANAKTMQKLQVIEELIDNNYALDMPDESTKEEGVYQGLIDSLGDPYSDYFTAEEMKAQQTRMQGVYYGIGAYVRYDEEAGYARLGEIFENSPAMESGLKEGDLIVKVDDQYTKGLALSEITGLIKGPEGTKVTLTIMREGESDFREIEVVRREVPEQTVTFNMLDDNIAYISISEFDTVTIDQFTEAMAMAKGSDMEGLILDLRDNAGGSLEAVIEVARQLLPKGLVVYTEDKAGKRVDYSCDGTKEIKVPMVVLVNGGSASASEILAGAIKDYGIGRLIGTTTFGKGIVQKYLFLSDNSAVKLTTSKYYTPKGNNIHGIGIEPDETLELDYERLLNEGYDNQLERAKEFLTKGE